MHPIVPAHPIYLIRHGQTEWNRDDKRQGRHDSPLTEKGLGQAAMVGATLTKLVDNRWSFQASPIPRAWRTAEIIGAACGLEPVADERLMEIGMGSWEGLTWPEIDAMMPGISATKNDYPQFHVPDGERFDDTMARAADWLGSIDRPTVAVSHGMIGFAIRSAYLGLDELGLRKLPSPRQDVLFLLRDGAITEVKCEA